MARGNSLTMTLRHIEKDLERVDSPDSETFAPFGRTDVQSHALGPSTRNPFLLHAGNDREPPCYYHTITKHRFRIGQKVELCYN